MSSVSSCNKKRSPGESERSSRRLGPRSPSGGRVEVLRRGTRGMDAERGTKGQGRPFVRGRLARPPERHRSEGSLAAGQTRMSGWPSLWLLSLGQTRESDSAGGPKPEVSAHSVSAVITEVQLCRNIQYCQSGVSPIPHKKCEEPLYRLQKSSINACGLQPNDHDRDTRQSAAGCNVARPPPSSSRSRRWHARWRTAPLAPARQA